MIRPIFITFKRTSRRGVRTGDVKVEGVELMDGTVIPATLGVMAVETDQFGPSHMLYGIEAAARQSGHALSWSEPGCYPGEPVFVPAGVALQARLLSLWPATPRAHGPRGRG